MKTSQKIVLLLLGMFFAIALFSCDPAKRISRIVKRHPELVKTDTVWQEYKDTTPKIDFKADFDTNKDVSGIDSLFMLLNGKVDSLTKARLLSSTKNYIINRPVVQDTLVQLIDGITVMVYDVNGRLGISIKKPEVITKKRIPVQVNSLQVAKALTWKERFKIFMFDNGWWIFIVLWAVWKLFGTVIKTALKTYFPWLSILSKKD